MYPTVSPYNKRSLINAPAFPAVLFAPTDDRSRQTRNDAQHTKRTARTDARPKRKKNETNKTLANPTKHLFQHHPKKWSLTLPLSAPDVPRRRTPTAPAPLPFAVSQRQRRRRFTQKAVVVGPHPRRAVEIRLIRTLFPYDKGARLPHLARIPTRPSAVPWALPGARLCMLPTSSSQPSDCPKIGESDALLQKTKKKSKSTQQTRALCALRFLVSSLFLCSLAQRLPAER
jgi:hypothetical protein